MIFLNISFKFQFNIYTFTVLIYIITIYEEITTESTFNVVQAVASPVLVGDLITRYEFINRGRGYSTPPVVT
ncbi:hypothetical protein, partial [Chryseobacterium cucumeris]|uniref:hypothetical protein n=1 Tax=Chryseobacterium cucumeris TaxID=1813611 RepID=UPI0023F3D482